MDSASRPTIVCGLNDSVESREALHAAARLSEGLGARLVLVHVAPQPTVPGASPVAGFRDTLRRAETVHGEELLAELVAVEGLERDIEPRVAFGPPAPALAAVAKEEGADFVVVGCRRQGPAKATLLGSVSAAILRAASCPVVLVSRPEPAEHE